ncbi:MAG: biopolymer transporter ExbD [Burkholderiales bacterium]|nr:biopolymer transporter ExbD [Burkholderiales bacterium]
MSFGRLERTPGSQPMSEINMTPLVDVMLVLVVIFIITAPLLVSAVKVDLPHTAGAAALEAPKFLSLAIDRNGQAYVDDLPMDRAALSTTLRQAAERHPETEVRLRADTAVPYGRVVEVMGLAHQAGLHRIGFVAQSDSAAR